MNNQSHAEKTIRLTAKFYEMRQQMRTLHGDEWQERITPYKTILSEVAKAQNLPIIRAALAVMQDAERQNVSSFDVPMFASAVLELMEGPEPAKGPR
jgi:hypothetical protein